jgi:hypothetical protein
VWGWDLKYHDMDLMVYGFTGRIQNLDNNEKPSNKEIIKKKKWSLN